MEQETHTPDLQHPDFSSGSTPAVHLQIQAALHELKRLTGVTLTLPAETPEDEEAALRQIRCLCTAYKEKYNKAQFLLSLMTDSVPSYDVAERALRLHIAPDENRILFLLESRSISDDTVLEILKNLFPAQSRIYLIPVTETQLAVLRPLHASESEEDLPQIAHTIVDTLNTEALAHVQVAYSGLVKNLLELSRAYKETSLALKVGRLFGSGQNVFPYNRLGIGRLIYQLPRSICENFLTEIFGTEIPSAADEEMTVTIDRFIQNNLNIAETARQLHMHRNTLIYRLEQVEKKNGLDLRRFEDAMTYKIASMVLNYLQTERNPQT